MGVTVVAGEAGGRVTVVAAIAAVSLELLGLQFMEKLACLEASFAAKRLHSSLPVAMLQL